MPGLRPAGPGDLVISPYARKGYIDHNVYSFDAYPRVHRGRLHGRCAAQSEDRRAPRFRGRMCARRKRFSATWSTTSTSANRASRSCCRCLPQNKLASAAAEHHFEELGRGLQMKSIPRAGAAVLAAGLVALLPIPAVAFGEPDTARCRSPRQPDRRARSDLLDRHDRRRRHRRTPTQGCSTEPCRKPTLERRPATGRHLGRRADTHLPRNRVQQFRDAAVHAGGQVHPRYDESRPGWNADRGRRDRELQATPTGPCASRARRCSARLHRATRSVTEPERSPVCHLALRADREVAVPTAG